MLRAAKLTDDREPRAPRGAAARGSRSRRADRARRRGRAARTRGRRPCRSSPSTSSGSSSAATRAAPRGATRRSVSSLPALKGLRRGLFGDALLRRVAGRLELSEAQLGSLIEGAARPERSPPHARRRDRNARPSTAPAQTIDQAARRAHLPRAVPRAPRRRRPDPVRDRPRAADHQRAAAPRRPPHRRPHALAARRPAGRRRAARAHRRRRWSPTPAGPGRVSEDELEHARLVLERDPARTGDPARSGRRRHGDPRAGARARDRARADPPRGGPTRAGGLTSLPCGRPAADVGLSGCSG